MNVGSVKYHPCGTSCTYKCKTVLCIVEFSEGGGISGHIITNIIRHLDYLKLYDNDRENGIIPALLIGGHVSRFDLGFWKYICDENHKRTIFLVFRMEHHCGR